MGLHHSKWTNVVKKCRRKKSSLKRTLLSPITFFIKTIVHISTIESDAHYSNLQLYYNTKTSAVRNTAIVIANVSKLRRKLFCDPGRRVRRQVSKGWDSVNYSIDFDDGDSTNDEVDE